VSEAKAVEQAKVRLKDYNMDPPAWSDVALLVADHDRLTREVGRLTRFINLLEPDDADRAEILNNPEFWATDFRHAMSKLAEVMTLYERTNSAEAEVERLRARIKELGDQAHARGPMIAVGWRILEQRAEQAEAEVERLRALIAVGPWDAWRNAEAEVARLRDAVEQWKVQYKGCNEERIAERDRANANWAEVERLRATLSVTEQDRLDAHAAKEKAEAKLCGICESQCPQCGYYCTCGNKEKHSCVYSRGEGEK
jgi:chromosome segregation ATPase